MAPTIKTKGAKTTTKSTTKQSAIQPTVNSDSESEVDSEDEGVDEEAMAKLMKALGDNLTPEEEQELREQLDVLGGQDSDEDVSGGQDTGEDVSDSDQEEQRQVSDDEEEEEEPDIALDDVDDAEASVDEDAVPQQKIQIDNKIALDRIRDTIKLDSSFPWTETLVLSYPKTIDVDVNDDLNRELAFYKQALHSANAAKTLAQKAKFPFTRPSDYFAEMVKSDAHMERIRQRLLDETAGFKKSDDKRREREGKKFGKQVQIEKIKEREKGKKEMEERLKGLKRKRGDVLENGGAVDDDFDIAVEDAIADRPSASKRGRGSSRGDRGSKIPRQARDQKYGFGGAGKRSKSNTRESTDNFDAGPSSRGGRGSVRGGRGASRGGARGRGASRGGAGGSKRLGKSRRVNVRSKTS